MKDNHDIEELFKNGLDGMESDVDPGIWENISSQISGGATSSGAESSSSSASSASSSASSGFVASTAVKIAAVVGTAGMIAAGAYFAGSDESNVATEQQNEAIQIEQSMGIEEEKVPVINETDVNESASLVESTAPEGVKIEEQLSEQPVSAHSNEEVSTNESASVNTQKPASTASTLAETPANVESTKKLSENEIQEESVDAEIQEEKSTIQPSIYASVQKGKIPLEVQFENRGSGSDKIEWRFDNGQYVQGESYMTHVFENSGKYWVVLRIQDEKGHFIKDSTLITVESNAFLEIPNVITPNGDGNNDYFIIKSENISSIRCQIMDRNMGLVTVFDGLNGHWDGRDRNGNPAVKGSTYFYVVEATDSEGKPVAPKRGSVTVW